MSSVLKESSEVHVPDPYSIPLEELDPAKVEIFQQDKLWGYFERYAKKTRCTFYPTVTTVPTGPSQNLTTSCLSTKTTIYFLPRVASLLGH